MKKLSLFIVVITLFFGIFLYYPKKLSVIPAINYPTRLIIPRINVDASIQSLGVNSKGEMEVPTNVIDVGWFKLGPQPGNVGSAVIAGHFNDQKGNPAVFANLDKLKIGDTIIVINNQQNIFTVFKTQIYNSGFAPEVFSSVVGNNLNLITCDGIWDNAKQSYSQRFVVFAH